MNIFLVLVLLGIGFGFGIQSGRKLALRQAAETVSGAEAAMRRELVHWQEAAERATAEAARIAREAEAYQAGRKSGREDVISIMPLLVAVQQRPGEARADGNDLAAAADN